MDQRCGKHASQTKRRKEPAKKQKQQQEHTNHSQARHPTTHATRTDHCYPTGPHTDAPIAAAGSRDAIGHWGDEHRPRPSTAVAHKRHKSTRRRRSERHAGLCSLAALDAIRLAAL